VQLGGNWASAACRLDDEDWCPLVDDDEVSTVLVDHHDEVLLSDS